MFLQGPAEPVLAADPGTADVQGRLRPVVQTLVGSPSLVAGGPRPRRALRPLLSRVDGQLVVGRIARMGRRKEEN